VSANQDTYPVGAMCRLLKVSKSGFYGWEDRPLSDHDRKDFELSALIHGIHERSHRTYGARRVRVELREVFGERVARKRAARLMRRAGLQGVQKRRFWCTTRSGAAERWAPDLVDRQFVADRPDALWVADATYVPTAEGWLYLAIVLDVFSRLVVGWAMAARLASQLVVQALEMAYAQRGPRDVIHHSDHGSEYTAIAFGSRCTKLGVRPSMGSVGDCYDNSMAESFFATLECEVLDRNNFQTREEARSALFCWIHSWYNPTRRHSSIGYVSPQEFERRFTQNHSLTPSASPRTTRGETALRGRPASMKMGNQEEEN
jgi:putative transposase